MTLTRLGRATGLALAVALLATLAAGCGLVPTQTASEESAVDSYYGEPVVEGEAAAPADAASTEGSAKSDAATVPEADRLIIRTKTLRLEVESTSDTVDEIRTLTKEHSGVITNLQVATDSDEWLYRYDEYGSPVSDGAALRGWVTVRVPADTFETFIDAASELGTVKYQSEASDDVTQEHVDMSARLANLRAEEARLREFFDDAENVSEMLAIEQELSRVRGEIESLDAQVKYLERQAAMATVTIELTEDRPVVRPEGESWGFIEAITRGIRGAANVLTFAITLLIAAAPLWITGLVVFFVVRAVIRRRKAKRIAPEAVAPVAPAVDEGGAEDGTEDEETATEVASPRVEE